MPEVDPEVHKGLAGVVVDVTAVSMVNAETNSLTYRGYPVQELAASCSFEEVAYLIWHGELPSDAQLDEFTRAERALRVVDPTVFEVLSALPVDCHPMDVLRTAVSVIGASDLTFADASAAANLDRSLSLMAKLPSIVAFDQRRRHGQKPLAPDLELSFAANFLRMCFGDVPEPEIVAAFEVSLILYAEHGFNASTFTARVVTSTMSDLYSAVTAAIGALKGPLHGGANEAVMYMLLEIEEPTKAAQWIHDALARKAKIMGFGHRVYKHGDSRVPTMAKSLEKVAALKNADKLMALYTETQAAMLAEKDIYPNLDFPTGPAYYLMGFDIPVFTPLFVLSRITGWTAHIIEQQNSNSLIRPLSKYVGPEQRLVPLH
ncbi:MAG TPA: bifunctional 2-methylcitrate synthase/citrate synthase [Acidothermaceae bacterium]